MSVVCNLHSIVYLQSWSSCSASSDFMCCRTYEKYLLPYMFFFTINSLTISSRNMSLPAIDGIPIQLPQDDTVATTVDVL